MAPPAGARLRLRRAVVTDAPFFLTLFNSPGWLRYIGDRGVYTEAQAGEYIVSRIVPSYATPGHGSYVAVLTKTRGAIGFVGVFQREGLAAPDFGFAFLPEAQGQGYALEAARTVLARPAVAALRELLAIVRPDNVRSRRLLEKLGFEVTDRTYPAGDADLLVYRRESRRLPHPT
ncbi:GNAT family N-acetyltransferase [Lewinella sp. IMCC34183]|uniref:GNAT family N-acetyltransferase n=1 Tax=Lewinella sp. IMCC34183 TaxID=2248762 RepID=UPI000E2721A0|nr:GNAT family N-acetyltransferase [Lewinella sp. IMCC34183]